MDEQALAEKREEERFVPHVYTTTDGYRIAQIRYKRGLGVGLLLNRAMCFMHEGRCAAVVRWEEMSDGKLVPKIYAPSAELAALLPTDPTILTIAELCEQKVLIDFRDVFVADQTYWIYDMRDSLEEGRSYYFSTSQSERADIAHLIPKTVYVYQEEVTSLVLSYDELVALVQEPPPKSVVIDTPLNASSLKRPSQYFKEGFRIVIENRTAVQQAYDEQRRAVQQAV